MSIVTSQYGPILAGQTVTIRKIKPGTSIGVIPGAGGTMNVQYRISLGGTLKAWPSGAVAVQTDEVLGGACEEVIISAATAAGVYEVCRP